MQECTRIVIDYFFDELLGWNYGYVEEYQEVSDLDEIEEWEFWEDGGTQLTAVLRHFCFLS